MSNKINANNRQDANPAPSSPPAVPEAGRPAASQKKADEDAGISPVVEVSEARDKDKEKVQEDFDYDSNGESLRRRSIKVGINEDDRPL